MKNITMKVDEKKQTLTLEIDLTKRFGPSKSGNTITIASTEGNQKIGLNDYAFGLSVYTKEGLPSKK
jgi:hypothetical protein